MRELVARAPEEYEELLSDHMRALIGHCRHFDAGEAFYAAEIANNLRTLLWHNPKGQSHSLLHQAGLEDVRFFDTPKTLAEGDPLVATAPHAGLVHRLVFPSVGGGLEEHWDANLSVFASDPPLTSRFEDWWGAIITVDQDGNNFSRARVVRNVANLDRGSHVAPGLDKAYQNATRGTGLFSPSRMIAGDAASNPEAYVDPSRVSEVSSKGSGLRLVRALLRQIAHEVIFSLVRDKENYLTTIPPQRTGLNPLMFLQFKLFEPTRQFKVRPGE